MLKITILITFCLMLISILAAAGFLLKNQSRQLLTSLTSRIVLAVLLMAQLLAWFYLR